MKQKKSLLVVSILLVAIPLMAFAPLPQSEEPGLTEPQLVIVGLIASAFTWGLNVLVSRGFDVKREHVAIGLYVVAFFTAILFTPVTFPPFPAFSDAPTFVTALLAYAGSLLALASPVVGIAFLVYNIFLKRVLDALFPAAKS